MPEPFDVTRPSSGRRRAEAAGPTEAARPAGQARPAGAARSAGGARPTEATSGASGARRGKAAGPSRLALAAMALRRWRPRQVWTMLVAAAGVTVLIGFATVLIPNEVFSRDIPPVWWNYPVWILTGVLSGALIATYVSEPGEEPSAGPRKGPGAGPHEPAGNERAGAPGSRLGLKTIDHPGAEFGVEPTDHPGAGLGEDSSDTSGNSTSGPADPDRHTRAERRSGSMGTIGVVLGWFAVGCPVCNKIALLALGYTGALTWFAPLQPVLALAALVLTSIALVWRLSGQVACPVPNRIRAGQEAF